MLARSVVRIANIARPVPARNLMASAICWAPKEDHYGNWTHSSGARPADLPADIIVPELADTLEWVLSCPPPVHQFEEPPCIELMLTRCVQIVVEIEHLKNLKPPQH